LRVREELNDQIVALGHSNVSYVDDVFYKRQLGLVDDITKNNYPVRVVAVEIGWLLNSPHGLAFLKSLHQSEALDLFEIECIYILIEYLYRAFKRPTLNVKLPIYITQMLVYILTIVQNENTLNDRIYKR
jgi:hypothetical protein